MNYSYFIGIDVSKLKLDIAIKDHCGKLIEEPSVIENNSNAVRKFIRTLRKKIKSELLFCLEPTGHYSNLIVSELLAEDLHVWVATPIDIQRSIGMTRGKNDKVDAIRIAEYAYRYHDKARLANLKKMEIQQLRELLTQRETFVTDRAKYKTQIREFKGRISETAYEAVRIANIQIIEALNIAIANIERQIKETIHQDEKLSRNYDLLQSIPGVGEVLAQTFIAVTSGLERFSDPRAFACHAGIAPFQYTSGSSIRGKNKVSHRANKRLKSLLHMAALSSIRNKGELREYYLRKVSEGKSKMSVINALRNKIVQRIFAVIKRNSYYQNLVIS